MKNDLKYLIIKDQKKGETIYLEGKKIEGYPLIKDRNKMINGINVNKMVIVNNSLIEKVINKKMDRKFKSLLELISSVCESDEDPVSGMMYALSELEKFRRMMFNEYIIYMNNVQLEKMDQKIKLIEQEVKNRLVEYNRNMSKEEMEIEKSSRRRR